jgi:hypothetical protein
MVRMSIFNPTKQKNFMNSQSKYNPADKGKKFNEDSPIGFEDITQKESIRVGNTV